MPEPHLHEPLDPELLYDYRGVPPQSGSPPLWLPHHQGDVYRGVDIPGIDDCPERLALLFLHPCTARAGAVLLPRVTVLAVRHAHTKVKPRLDHNNFAIMALPDLLGTGAGTWRADFLSVGMIASNLLDRHQRVATLTEDGRLALQQRIVNHFTRFKPSLTELAEGTRAVEAEVTLQADWSDAACQAAGRTDLPTIVQAERDFDAYLNADNKGLRLGLKDDPSVTTRTILMEIRRRYP